MSLVALHRAAAMVDEIRCALTTVAGLPVKVMAPRPERGDGTGGG